MNKSDSLSDTENTILAVLESAGTTGMFRSEILDHPDCDAIENAQDVSNALNKLWAKKGLIFKGDRHRTKGFRWYYAIEQNVDAESKNNAITDSCQHTSIEENQPIEENLQTELAALAAKMEVHEVYIDMPETKIRTLRKLADVTSGAIGSILNDIADDIDRLTVLQRPS